MAPTHVDATDMAGIEGFDPWLEARQYAPGTRRVYCMYARRANLHVPLDHATEEQLAEWWEMIPHTAPSRIAARKALIVYYRYTGRVPSPADRLPVVAEPRRLPRPLSEAEHRLWVCAAHDLGGLWEMAGVMLASTGARIGELRAARWQDLSLTDPGWWRIRGKGAGRSGPRWRQQPLHPDAVQILGRVIHHGEWVFPGRTGCIEDWTMRTLLVEIGEHAGLGRITPHRLRHSIGTLALAQTGNLRAVQLLLGHSNISSTTIYTAVLPERLRTVVAALPV